MLHKLERLPLLYLSQCKTHLLQQNIFLCILLNFPKVHNFFHSLQCPYSSPMITLKYCYLSIDCKFKTSTILFLCLLVTNQIGSRKLNFNWWNICRGFRSKQAVTDIIKTDKVKQCPVWVDNSATPNIFQQTFMDQRKSINQMKGVWEINLR